MNDNRDNLLALIEAGHLNQARELCAALGQVEELKELLADYVEAWSVSPYKLAGLWSERRYNDPLFARAYCRLMLREIQSHLKRHSRPNKPLGSKITANRLRAEAAALQDAVEGKTVPSLQVFVGGGWMQRVDYPQMRDRGPINITSAYGFPVVADYYDHAWVVSPKTGSQRRRRSVTRLAKSIENFQDYILTGRWDILCRICDHADLEIDIRELVSELLTDE